MTSRGQCPRGGGMLVNVFTPLQEILYPRLQVFHLSKFRPPPTWMAGYGPAYYSSSCNIARVTRGANAYIYYMHTELHLQTPAWVER